MKDSCEDNIMLHFNPIQAGKGANAKTQGMDLYIINRRLSTCQMLSYYKVRPDCGPFENS